MPHAIRASATRRFLFALVVAAAAACGGDSSTPTGPPTSGRRIAIGDTVVGTANGTTPNVHSFTAAGGQRLAVQIEVTSGHAHITVTDSSTGAAQTTATFAAPVTIDHGITASFNATTTVYLVTVTTDPSSSVAFRYVVHLVDTNPEANPAQLTYGTAIVEPLGTAFDEDDFFFDGVKDQEVIVYLQGIDNPFPGIFYTALSRDSTTITLGSTYGHNGDPDPESNTTGRVILPSTGRYRVHVENDPTRTTAYIGNYRLEVALINRAPEHTPAAVVPGDTISGEAIEHVGDIDEFKLTAAANDEYNVFLQAATGPASNALVLELVSPASALLNSVPSIGTDTLQLLQNGLSSFKTTTPGVYTIRVRGQSDLGGLNRGAYRVYVHKINRHPETISGAARVLGDTIAGESIEVPGDIDEIPVTISAPTLIHIQTTRYGGLPHHTLIMHLRRLSDDSLITGNELDLQDGVPLPYNSGSTTASIDPGSYVLRVSADSRQFGYRGGWRAILQAIDSMPEGRSKNFAGADTVVGTIDPPGDIDIYRMPVHTGEHWQIFFQGSYNGGVGSTFYAKTDTASVFPNQQLGTSASAGLTDAPHTGRLDVLSNNTYQVTVLSNGQGQFPAERGPYRFVILPFDGAPEHHAPIIAPGDSVTDELLDFLGDLDQFDLAGAPGQELIIDLRADMPAGPAPGLWVRVLDPISHDSITGMQSYIAAQTTRRFRLPASGHVRVEALAITSYLNTGPYYLKVQPINRAPETLPAPLVVGDTLSGESLDYGGDQDEFTFSGTAGQKYKIYIETVTGDPSGGGMRAELSAAGSDVSLGSVTVTNPDLLLNNGSSTITLPASGAYVLRVRYEQEFLVVPAAAYRVVLVSVP
jgi:hypothetical protein